MRLEAWQRGIASALNGGGSRWSREGFAAHRGNVQGARLQALKEIYPVTKRILGVPQFRRLADRDISEIPSRCADLNAQGKDFPEWLKRVAEISSLSPGYLPDLARLERASHNAYRAVDDKPAKPETYLPAEGQPERFRFRLSNSLSLISSPWPLDKIWAAGQSAGGTADVTAEASHLAVWRAGAHPKFESLNTVELEILHRASLGHSIRELACQGITPTMLNRFVANGWIVGIEPTR